MKEAILIYGYWTVDSNKWDAEVFTKEQSEKNATTLINCSNCSDCSDCSDCSYFKTNPERITSAKIGSRNSQSTYYWTNEHEMIICGCFSGTLQEFENKVKEKHQGNDHEIAYMNWINKIKAYKS